MSNPCPQCGSEGAVTARQEIAHMESAHPEIISARLEAAGIEPRPPDELAERMKVIEIFALFNAIPDCPNCNGDGLDYEGSEWAVCECITNNPGWEESRRRVMAQ